MIICPAPGQKKKWERFQTDGVTPHQYIRKKEETAGDISGFYR